MHSVSKGESEMKETWKQPLTTVRNGAKDRQQFIPRILGSPPPEQMVPVSNSGRNGFVAELVIHFIYRIDGGDIVLL